MSLCKTLSTINHHSNCIIISELSIAHFLRKKERKKERKEKKRKEKKRKERKKERIHIAFFFFHFELQSNLMVILSFYLNRKYLIFLQLLRSLQDNTF